MTSRARVEEALAFRAPDAIPLQIYAAPGGLYEHGNKLLDRIRRCGHDFGPLDDLCLPEPPPATDFDPDGAYHATRTDEWGVTWEYRIFGVWVDPRSPRLLPEVIRNPPACLVDTGACLASQRRQLPVEA